MVTCIIDGETYGIQNGEVIHLTNNDDVIPTDFICRANAGEVFEVVSKDEGNNQVIKAFLHELGYKWCSGDPLITARIGIVYNDGGIITLQTTSDMRVTYDSRVTKREHSYTVG